MSPTMSNQTSPSIPGVPSARPTTSKLPPADALVRARRSHIARTCEPRARLGLVHRGCRRRVLRTCEDHVVIVSFASVLASTMATVAALAAVLAVAGVALAAVGIRLIRATRTDPAALGALEVMGERKWARGDAQRRAEVLASARPVGDGTSEVVDAAQIGRGRGGRGARRRWRPRRPRWLRRPAPRPPRSPDSVRGGARAGASRHPSRPRSRSRRNRQPPVPEPPPPPQPPEPGPPLPESGTVAGTRAATAGARAAARAGA